MHHVFPQEFNMGFMYSGFEFLIRFKGLLYFFWKYILQLPQS